MADAKLVHGVERAPRLALDIKQVNLAISVRVLASDQNDLSWLDG